ncbi:phage shock protein PspC (stress-responsive transcriptional regulator) [Arthrobacter stackebrandtii]|uniref:Phage shock protein PspC (Stress-responsive transcriptional regulator) n=1 Tax=Arthrobacter stackebrandtii TaxID=272161 RepID=A0ABS4YWV1_9MICC|nr:PspC domain-containing protein [Arthrobacter stackebrandtii]MBP2413290.1 phage shock protein PspC (stress-responsive transcriptional regulator) [Arthrobacter stackebrandtii]PYG99613.1 hypothetical protein CVV67_14885 [Arthrobacter stackebrandtii]
MNTSHDLPDQPEQPEQPGKPEQPVSEGPAVPGQPAQPEPHQPAAGQPAPEQPAPGFPFTEQPASGMPNPGQPFGYPAPPPQAGRDSARFFQWLRGLGIRRGSNRWMGGVCSGLADKWGIDPVIVRGAAVVLTLFFGVGLLAYGVAWALLPEPDGRIHAEEVGRGNWSGGMTGATIMSILGMAGPGFGGNDGWVVWPLVWVAGIVGVIYWYVNRDKINACKDNPGQSAGQAPGQGRVTLDKKGQENPSQGAGSISVPGQSWYGWNWQPGAGTPGTDTGTNQPAGWSGSGNPGSAHDKAPMPGYGNGPAPAAPPNYAAQPYTPAAQTMVKPRHPKPRLGAPASLLALGLAAIVGAAVLILDASGILDLHGYQAGVAAAAAAITTGAAIMAAGALGRTAGGLGTASVIMLIVAGLASLPAQAGPFSAVNQTSWTPLTAEAAEAGRTVVFSNGTLDLTKIDDETPLDTDVAIAIKSVASNVTVKVPASLPVTLNSEIAAASLTINGKDDGGALAQQGTTELNPKATGSGLVITLEGVASNINFETVAGQ